MSAAAAALIALIAFVFSVWSTHQSAVRESNRRDWERLQALAQVLYGGATYGEWAQRLAIQELYALSTRRHEVLELAKDALIFWDGKQGVSPAVLLELRSLVANLQR